jgi:hypothetical protein
LPFLSANAAYLAENLREKAPKIKFTPPEGTFLAWLDCRALGLTDEALHAFFAREAKLGLNKGTTFGTQGSGFMRLNFGCTIEDAGAERVFKACALVMKDILSAKLADTEQRKGKNQDKHVHYLSMEFLLGRSLEKNTFNIGMLDALKEAISSLGYDADDFFETEPDAALGNGGLGRLAACYLEAMTTQDIPATGYSIMYEYGIFRQKLVDGWQTEMPDFWLPGGEAWLLPRPELTKQVRFDGNIREWWDEEYHHVEHENAAHGRQPDSRRDLRRHGFLALAVRFLFGVGLLDVGRTRRCIAGQVGVVFVGCGPVDQLVRDVLPLGALDTVEVHAIALDLPFAHRLVRAVLQDKALRERLGVHSRREREQRQR